MRQRGDPDFVRNIARNVESLSYTKPMTAIQDWISCAKGLRFLPPTFHHRSVCHGYYQFQSDPPSSAHSRRIVCPTSVVRTLKLSFAPFRVALMRGPVQYVAIEASNERVNGRRLLPSSLKQISPETFVQDDAGHETVFVPLPSVVNETFSSYFGKA